MIADTDLAQMIQPGRVHRGIYTDPQIFELELERIFGRAWIYVAHESQVRRPGDYITTRHGRDRIIVTRHTDGALHAMYNRCTHRGAAVCATRSGNTKTFVCPYHAWSFRTDGALDGIPHGAAGYGAGLQGKMDELGLERLPRVASYRGFVFASKAAEGVGLPEFLGPAIRDVFDNFIDRSPSGELEVAGGKMVQVYRGNWKFQIENSIDLLHPSILHKNAVDAAAPVERAEDMDYGVRTAVELNGQNWHTFREWDQMGVHSLPRGHCYMGSFFKKSDKPIDEEARFGSDDAFRFDSQAAYKAALVARHGREKTEEILTFSRHNTIVYPNLFVNPRMQQVRILHPTAHDRTEQHSEVLRFVGAPEEGFQIAVRLLSANNSPSSMATADDHEVFEQMQRSLGRGSNPWLDMSRALGQDVADGVDRRAPGTSESPMRNQHRAWADYMTGAL